MVMQLRARQTNQAAYIGQHGDGIVFSSLQSLLHLQAQVRILTLAKRHSRARYAGLHRSVHKGRGMDFAESRIYQPGDDIRTIDWRVTARSGRIHTKIFEEEREKPVLLWMDLRPSMFFATRGRFKSVVAAEMAALLLWKTLEDGDRIGGILQNSSPIELKPSRSRLAALHLLRELSEMTRHGASAIHSVRSEALQTSWTRLRRVTPAGSQVFVVSDFRQATPTALRQLAMISRHSQVTLMVIHDPFEDNLPSRGKVRLTDGGKRQLWVNLQSRSWRNRYHERAQQARKMLQDFSRSYRLPLIELSTTDTRNTCLLKLSQGVR